MGVPSPALNAPSLFDALKSFLKRHRNAVVITLVVVLCVIPINVYYAMSYNSVNGTTVQIASVKRTVNREDFGGIKSVTYQVEAHVWSHASLDTQVNDPSFSLDVANYGTLSDQGGNSPSATFKPNNYALYYLNFSNTNSQMANELGAASSNTFSLEMDAFMSAGVYGSSVTVRDSRTFTF